MNRWRVDLKWVFGILCTLVLILTLPALALFQATGRGRAEQTLSDMRQPLVSDTAFRGELSSYAPEVLAFLESPDFGRRVYDDPALLRGKIDMIPAAGQVLPAAGEPLPDGGKGEAVRSMLELYITPMEFLSAGVHAFFKGAIIILMVFLLLLGAPFVLFSRGPGKAVSTGVSLAAAAWVPFLVFNALDNRSLGWTPESNGSGEEFEQRRILEEGINHFVRNLVDASLSVYLLISLLALCLLAGGGIAAIVLRGRVSQPGSQGGTGF